MALECLQRAFEVGISYALYIGGGNKKADLLKLRFDTEMLVTGKKSEKTLAEKYAEEKDRDARLDSYKTYQKQRKKSVQQSYTLKSKKPKKTNFYKYSR